MAKVTKKDLEIEVNNLRADIGIMKKMAEGREELIRGLSKELEKAREESRITRRLLKVYLEREAAYEGHDD